MNNRDPDVSIIGLPESGKTTLLAAIWHMVREPGSITALKFNGLSQGNYEHLNALAKRWRAGKKQQRTQTDGLKVVSMNLRNSTGDSLEVSFPDMPGEDFSRMWEKRELDQSMCGMLSADAIVLLINGDTIKFPAWIVEQMEVAKGAGIPPEQAEVVEWSAELAPTQVKVVELLQFLMSGTLSIGPRRLALLISAWDQVEGDGLDPAEVLEVKLPLLNQYLRSARDPWTWRIWGLSAQGGEYEDQDKGEQLEVTAALRDLDRPSDRIKVIDGKNVSSDITQPLNWLMG
ncbi:TRAFAC clade GTPase domain-containing protein [Roseibium album]|uniref:TRAFAC clade GTPase domain-containing protein n=1 Tax=Roseibium album TaxID=311410 RepID=UPI00391B1D42